MLNITNKSGNTNENYNETPHSLRSTIKSYKISVDEAVEQLKHLYTVGGNIK